LIITFVVIKIDGFRVEPLYLLSTGLIKKKKGLDADSTLTGLK